MVSCVEEKGRKNIHAAWGSTHKLLSNSFLIEEKIKTHNQTLPEHAWIHPFPADHGRLIVHEAARRTHGAFRLCSSLCPFLRRLFGPRECLHVDNNIAPHFQVCRESVTRNLCCPPFTSTTSSTRRDYLNPSPRPAPCEGLSRPHPGPHPGQLGTSPRNETSRVRREKGTKVGRWGWGVGCNAVPPTPRSPAPPYLALSRSPLLPAPRTPSRHNNGTPT